MEKDIRLKAYQEINFDIKILENVFEKELPVYSKFWEIFKKNGIKLVIRNFSNTLRFCKMKDGQMLSENQEPLQQIKLLKVLTSL